MAYDRFLIAPINTGLQTDLRPWLIPNDAFQSLENAYVFRGRIRKRFGGMLMGSGSGATAQFNSRLRINLGNSDGSGNYTNGGSAILPSGAIYKIGQAFSVTDNMTNATQMLTVWQASGAMLTTGGGVSGTFNTSTGVVSIAGTKPATAVFFYPAEPVMGLTTYESGTANNQPAYAFDTRFAYIFSGGAWSRSGSGSNPLWHGSNLNFYWTTNWLGASSNNVTLFVTNFQVTNPNGAGTATDDPIWYTTNGSTWTSATGANGFYFKPAGGAPQTGPFVQTCRIILPFKDRLLLLNTIENNNTGSPTTNTAYTNRCRYSINGSPFAQNAWYEPNQQDNGGTPVTSNAAGAGFIDAPTKEQIISAEFIKDRLIVYFERSTWELAYTGNQILPFVWQKINTELGSEAPFSTVPFDQAVLTIGVTGVHSCNGSNVQRIDNKIPDEIFEFNTQNNDNQRVWGIRDYTVETVYWTFNSVDQNTNETYPNKILVYNYRDQSWALNDDCITAFGYFEQQMAPTWSSTSLTWQNYNLAWSDGIIFPDARQVIAGNQQGFVFLVVSGGDDQGIARNAPVMQITNMTTSGGITTLYIRDHTLQDGEYIAIENAQGSGGFSLSGIFQVSNIQPVFDANQVTIIATFTGSYTGGGQATRVSNIGILSKQWNPYVDKDQNVYLAKIDFAVAKTTSGQVTVDYYPSDSELSMIQEGTDTGMIMGNNVLETSPYDPALYPFEAQQNRLWHPIYFQSVGECIQIFIYMSPTQITNTAIAFSDFEIEGMCLYTTTAGSRLQ